MKLLLPYAYDPDGNLVSIDDVTKGQKYTCPACGAELSLRISKIPPGQKHHRRNHFAHKGNTDNHCSESFLHKLFKERCAEFISNKIAKQETLYFYWRCKKCYEEHKGNLLKTAKKVDIEYNLGVCKPDIALLDGNDDAIIVIEIVVTHKPEDNALKYYEDNNIACLQINVDDFSDCDNIEKKLSRPSEVSRCPNPICQECGNRKNTRTLITTTASCWSCGQRMKIAMILVGDDSSAIPPSDFNEQEINIAKSLGVNITKKYSNIIRNSYLANTCEHCNNFIGDNHMYKYCNLPHEEEKFLDYTCQNCAEKRKREEYLAERRKDDQLQELISKGRDKVCPKCGFSLKVKYGKRGPFWGCANYPYCNYTENIVLE